MMPWEVTWLLIRSRNCRLVGVSASKERLAAVSGWVASRNSFRWLRSTQWTALVGIVGPREPAPVDEGVGDNGFQAPFSDVSVTMLLSSGMLLLSW